jgi:hypothetical protein
MSDRELILRILEQAESRLRTNRILDRLARGLAVWSGLGVLVRLVDLAWGFAPETILWLGILWLLGTAGIVVWSVGRRSDLRAAARALDRGAHLDDELLSAWWFVEGDRTAARPGVALHLERTAARLRKLDLPGLCPRLLPRMAWAAAAGLIALVVLDQVPLPLASGRAPGPPAPPDARGTVESLMEEIEDLLSRAEALEPDGMLAAFQELSAGISDPGAGVPDIEGSIDALGSQLQEGNLSTQSILEGLEDMAGELMGASETAAAGEALADQDIEGAASELEALAEALRGGDLAPGEDLAQALARAGEDSRAGLEALSESLRQAADGLGGQDTAGAGEALARAGEALRDLSDRVESQDLRNQAAERLESLEDALREAARGENGEPGNPGSESSGRGEPSDDSDAPQAGDSAPPSREPGEPGEPGEGQPGGEGSGETSPTGASPGGEPGGDETGQGEAAAGGPGAIEGPRGGDSGLLPAGLGFSPEQKTGLATSLEVQLRQVTTEALPPGEAIPSGIPPEEEASRQERSRLDYRDVPSDLTPAQQELLDQERIPREYRDLIRDYFQAIRPPIEP